MEQRVEEKNIKLQDKKKVSIIEKIGKKIPYNICYILCSSIIFNTFFRWKNF